MSPDVTIKISFGGEGASVAVSPATGDVPSPMPIEELYAGRPAEGTLPRPSLEQSGPGTASFGAPAPLPLEELLAGSEPSAPTPQPGGAPQAGGPPGPMPIEELGAARPTAVPGPVSPEAPKTTARRRRSPSTR